MTWRDDHGRALALEEVFAAHLGGVKQRLGLIESRAGQRRTRRNAEAETIELQIRSATGTARYADAVLTVPVKRAREVES